LFNRLEKSSFIFNSVKVLLLFLIVIWILGIISPLFLNKNQIDLYFLLKLFYTPVCHQNPEKSFVCNGFQLLVCARCLGIYLGVLISNALIIINFTPPIKLGYIFLSSLPMIIDIIFYQFGVYSYNKIIALITGISFGTILFLFIFEIIRESILKVNR